MTIGGKRVREDAAMNAMQQVRVGDVMDLKLYSVGFENGELGVNTKIRVLGMTHRGKRGTMDVGAYEVRL